MPAPVTVMTPAVEAEARRLIEAGLCRKHVAERLGVHESTLGRWAKRRDLRFKDGRPHAIVPRTAAFYAAARRNVVKATAAAAKANRLPLNRLERARYYGYMSKARRAGVVVTRDDALRAIGRPDLVGETA